MLTLFLVQILFIVICVSAGFLFYKYILPENQNKPIIFYAITGLISLTTISQIVVLFTPLTIYIRFLFLFLIVVSILINWQQFQKFCRHLYNEITALTSFSNLLFLITWLIILLINAGPTMMDDTESYHIQSIKWLQEYGSVPGLVNLHERFGFNSSWFSSVALFSFSSKTTGGFTVLNSVLSMWLCYWFISKYNQFRQENNLQVAFAILLIFIASIVIWPLIRGNAATTNYDFITTAIVLILFTEAFFSEKFSPSIECMIWPVYLFTVRIINFPLLALSLFVFISFIKNKNFRASVLPLLFCLLLIVPFLIRNIIIAGYPFYPATYFDFINVDWKPDPQITERLLEYIKYYNRVSTTYLDIEQTKALGSAWVPAWFQHLFLFDKILVVVGLAGILFSCVKLFIQKKNYNKSIITGLMAAWIIWWFIVSPDPRFIYGILLLGIFLFAFHLISSIKNNGAIRSLSKVLMILLAAGLSYYLVSKPWRQKEYRNWLAPLQLPQPPAKEIVIDEITFRMPELINNNWNARCYGTELPCLYKIDHRLRARGKNIRSGFHLEK